MNRVNLRRKLAELEPLQMGSFPTPMQPLIRLSQWLAGPEIWIKRDDLDGLGGGGNKIRKLNFLLAEAIRQGADIVLTTGATQSNHARQTAAMAARLGLACRLVLRGDDPPPAENGNYLLDRLLGAEIRWTQGEDPATVMEREADDLRKKGRTPYIIPYGGSNAIGIMGFVAAFREFIAQSAADGLPFDAIVVASSSGGTQAGLTLGAKALGWPGEVIGVSIADPKAILIERMVALANEGAELLDLDFRLHTRDFHVSDAFLGGGYGVVGRLEREAIRTLARIEGIFVDPVYTGRALGGLMEMIRSGDLREAKRILFWHTGGTPAIYAYHRELLR